MGGYVKPQCWWKSSFVFICVRTLCDCVKDKLPWKQSCLQAAPASLLLALQNRTCSFKRDLKSTRWPGFHKKVRREPHTRCHFWCHWLFHCIPVSLQFIHYRLLNLYDNDMTAQWNNSLSKQNMLPSTAKHSRQLKAFFPTKIKDSFITWIYQNYFQL